MEGLQPRGVLPYQIRTFDTEDDRTSITTGDLLSGQDNFDSCFVGLLACSGQLSHQPCPG
ncbi:Uncharacterised protein [Mycobacteroides abscessus subsp. abscessus]|nr:Uncharacterised protein [Mycobacteroides abscessus subsp. abscessus]